MKLLCKHEYITKEQTVYCKNCGDHFEVKCGHEWKIQHEKRFVNKLTNNEGIDTYYTCKKCGEWKAIKWID